ncbi:hypothetical protein Tco_0620903 [Tanacetum coccineum]
MTRSSTKELITPFENPERIFRSKKRLFETPGLVESSLPEFDLFSNIKGHSEEEETTEIMMEIMEQYMSMTSGNYGGSEHEDVNEHIIKVLKIVDLFHIPEILDLKGVVPIKTAADAKVAIQEMAEYSQKWHNKTSSKSRSTNIAKISRNRSKPDNHGHGNGIECAKARRMLSKLRLWSDANYAKDHTTQRTVYSKKRGKLLKRLYYTHMVRPDQPGGNKRHQAKF